MKTHLLYIHGELVAPTAPATLDVIDPSTTEVIARVPDANPADVHRAVAAARAAFDDGPWKDATAQDRGRVLFELAGIVRARAAELAELETRNTGKPIVEAEFDIGDVATCFEYYGGLATKIHGDVIPVPSAIAATARGWPTGSLMSLSSSVDSKPNAAGSNVLRSSDSDSSVSIVFAPPLHRAYPVQWRRA